MHLHTRNISAAAMYMKEQRSTQLKILVVGIAGIKLQKVRLSVIYDRVRNRKNHFEIPDFLNSWMENLQSGKFKWNQNTNKHISVAGKHMLNQDGDRGDRPPLWRLVSPSVPPLRNTVWKKFEIVWFRKYVCKHDPLFIQRGTTD